MISYKDATDKLRKHNRYSASCSSLFIGKQYGTMRELFDAYIDGFQSHFAEYCKDNHLYNIDINSYSLEDGYITIVFSRDETESEYMKRKSAEEKQRQQSLSAQERRLIKEKATLKSKYNQYKHLEEFFKGLSPEFLEDLNN